jgi:predicted AlkP superfamily phosphohydrolase/phosphomutase
VYFNDWLRELGYLEIDRRSASNLNAWLWRIGLSRDRLARLLELLPKGLSRWLVGRASRFEVPLDLAKTAAFYEPIYEFVGGIRLVDRKTRDVSEDRLRDELTALLTEVTDPEDGSRVVQQVYKREEIYHGPHADGAPDLIVVLNPRFAGNHRMGNKTVVAERVELASHAQVVGAHRMDGIFMAAGPEMSAIANQIFHLSIEDLAPTILYSMGVSVPDTLDGRVLTEVFRPEVIAAHPPQSAAGKFWDRESEEVAFSPEEELEVRRQLEGLGYLNN